MDNWMFRSEYANWIHCREYDIWLNLNFVEQFLIEYRGEDYTKPYEVQYSMHGRNYKLAAFNIETDAINYVKNILKQ